MKGTREVRRNTFFLPPVVSSLSSSQFQMAQSVTTKLRIHTPEVVGKQADCPTFSEGFQTFRSFLRFMQGLGFYDLGTGYSPS